MAGDPHGNLTQETVVWSPVQVCPQPRDKLMVLKEMIFPQCEKLGQTIIFVRTRESARALHSEARTTSTAGCSLF